MTRHVSATDDPIRVQQFLGESMETIGEEIPRIPPTEIVVENEQIELINRGSDVETALTIPTEKDDGSQKTESRDYTDPKSIAYLLRTYIPLIYVIVGKLALEKQALIVSTAHPLMKLSVVSYVVACLNLSFLACAYYVSKNWPQRQYFSPRLYMILNFTYYILCVVAHLLLVPMIFISQNH